MYLSIHCSKIAFEKGWLYPWHLQGTAQLTLLLFFVENVQYPLPQYFDWFLGFLPYQSIETKFPQYLGFLQ